MKKILFFAISLLAVSAFAAGVAFKANPLALLQSGGGGDKDKKAPTEQVAAEQTTKTNAKQKAGELLNAKKTATSDNERLRINAELVKSGNIRFLTPQEIEAVKKSGLLITSHDTGWQDVAFEQVTVKDPEQQRMQKFTKEEISKAPTQVYRVAYDENGKLIEKTTMNRLEYLESPSRFTKEESENNNPKK